MKEIIEIKSLNQFRELKTRNKGWVIISDTNGTAYIHKINETPVDEENFIKKVIQNNCQNGRYY